MDTPADPCYDPLVASKEAKPMNVSRKEIEKVYHEQGYKAAKALADQMGIIWFASTNAERKVAPTQASTPRE